MITHPRGTRKDRHPPPAGTEPSWLLRLGPLTGLALVAIAIMQWALVDMVQPNDQSLVTQCWLACIWGGWAAMVWIWARQPLRISRAAGLGVVLGWHCLLLSTTLDRPPQRYVVTLGSYGLLQALAAVLLQLPEWRGWRAEDAGRGRGRHRFGILSVLVLTTGVAVVMFAARLYAGDGGNEFLSGAVLVSAALCTVSIVAILTSSMDWSPPEDARPTSSRAPLANRLLAALMRALGLAALIVAALLAAWIITALSDLGSEEDGSEEDAWEQTWRIYASVLIQFGGILFLVGLCGREDARRVSAAPQDAQPPPL